MERWLLVAISDQTDKKTDLAIVSNQDLADLCGVSVRCIQQTKARLVELGKIEETKRTGSKSCLRVCMSPDEFDSPHEYGESQGEARSPVNGLHGRGDRRSSTDEPGSPPIDPSSFLSEAHALPMLYEMRESSRDRDGVARLSLGAKGKPNESPPQRLIALAKLALARHPCTLAEVQAIGFAIAAGELYGNRRCVSAMVLLQVPTLHKPDFWADCLAVVRSPGRRTPDQRHAKRPKKAGGTHSRGDRATPPPAKPIPAQSGAIPAQFSDSRQPSLFAGDA